jgi:hypothetical protein
VRLQVTTPPVAADEKVDNNDKGDGGQEPDVESFEMFLGAWNRETAGGGA